MPPGPADPTRRAPRLGHLELAVLDLLWETGVVPVTDAHAAVGAPRGLSRSTIHTTLERLVRKGLVQRERRGRAYVYRAVTSRSDWITRAVADVLDAIPGADAPLVLASFVDLAERTGEETLRALEELVGQRRRGPARDEEDDA
jgi:predicted transcriptional regulator